MGYGQDGCGLIVGQMWHVGLGRFKMKVGQAVDTEQGEGKYSSLKSSI